MILEDERVLLSGSSSGALISFITMMGWDSMKISTEFSQYYMIHHRILQGDASAIAARFLNMVVGREMTHAEQEIALARCNRRLFVHVSRTTWKHPYVFGIIPSLCFEGELKHGWTSIAQLIRDVQSSCSIPFFTCSGPDLFDGTPHDFDGGITDYSPRLLYTPINGDIDANFKWAKRDPLRNLVGALFTEAADMSSPTGATQTVPYKIISPDMFVSQATTAHVMLPINMHLEFVRSCSALGFEDARLNKQQFVDFGLELRSR